MRRQWPKLDMTREQLAAELERSRRAIRRSGADLKWELDFNRKTRESIRNHRFAWLGGAAAFGFLLAGSRRSKRARVVEIPAGPEPSEGTSDEKPHRKPKRKPEVSKAIPTILTVILGAVRLLLPVLRPLVTAYAAKKLAQIADKVNK